MAYIDPKYAYGFFLQRGYTPAAAAGIVGNIHAESGFNTGASGDKGSAYGLTQLRGSRRDGLSGYASQQGLDPSAPDAQLGYIDYEMKSGTDAGAGRAYGAIQNASSPAEAAQAFMQNYERPNANPAVNNIAGRQSFANQMMGVDPSTGVTPVNLASQGTGIASLTGMSLPTQTAAAATPTASDDPMSTVFSALAAGIQQPQAPVAQPAPMQRRQAPEQSIDEKMAETSQTPNVYYDRLRMEQNG